MFYHKLCFGTQTERKLNRFIVMYFRGHEMAGDGRKDRDVEAEWLKVLRGNMS